MLDLAEHRVPEQAKRLRKKRTTAKQMERLNQMFRGLLQDPYIL